MNPRSALNIALAAISLAVAAGLYFRPKSSTPDAAASFPVITNDAENLQRIEIQRTNQPSIVLERGAGQWTMQAPIRARLDEIQLGRILEVTRARASARMRADDLARFELDKPWAQIRFNRYVIDFGATNTLTQELYVRSGEYVYAIQPRFAAAVPSSLAKILAHRVLAADEQPRAFELARFAIRHDGRQWQLSPRDPGLSQDDLVRWVEQWRSASSIVTQPASAGAALESVSIELGAEKALVLDVLARSPELVLMRRDEGLQYHLPARLAQALLAPPNSASIAER